MNDFVLKGKNKRKGVTDRKTDNTPPIEEIIWVKNVRAIVVCEFLMK